MRLPGVFAPDAQGVRMWHDQSLESEKIIREELAREGVVEVAESRNANQENDHHTWLPSTKVGEIMADPLNPVLFER